MIIATIRRERLDLPTKLSVNNLHDIVLSSSFQDKEGGAMELWVGRGISK